MITKYEKANRGKLLVAVMALAMVLAGAAVIFSDSEVSATTLTQEDINSASDNTITASGAIVLENNINLEGKTLNMTGYTLTTAGYDITGGKITGNGQPSTYNNGFIIGLSGDSKITGTEIVMNVVSGKMAAAAIVVLDRANATISGGSINVNGENADDTFGAIQTTNANVTVSNVEFGDGALVTYKPTSQTAGQAKITLNGCGDVGLNFPKDVTLSKDYVVIGSGTNVVKTVLGWDKSISNAIDNTTSVTLTVAGDYNLGELDKGDSGDSGDSGEVKMTVTESEGGNVTYTGATGVTVNKDNSDRTGISNNVVALEGDIIIDGEAYLVGGDVTIPANKNVIIRNGGSLDLAGCNLILNGKLTIENRGSVIGTTGEEKIVLKSGASIENNGALGGSLPVSVYANDASGSSYATLQNVVGVSFGLIKNDDASYALSVTGDVSRATGTTSSDKKELTLNSVTVNGDLTTSKDVTLAGTFIVARNGTVTTDGPMTATATLQYGATANINGAFSGTINAKVEEKLSATNAGNNKYTGYATTSFTSSGTAVVTGFTVTVDRTQYTDNNGDVMFNQRAYISGNIDTTVRENMATLAISGNVFVASGVTFTTATYTAIDTTDNGLIIVDGTVVTSDEPEFDYVGAFYTITAEGERNATGYITSFDAAMNAIADADNDTIIVSGNTAFPIKVTGTYTLEANQVVDSSNDAALEIAESGKITVNDSAEFDAAAIAAIDGMVTVMYGGDCEPADNLYDVKSTNEAGDVTYAGLQIVLNNAQAGDEITVTGQNAEATTLTVPNGVTLNIEGKLTVQRSVTVAQGGILNVEGTLEIGKNSSSDAKAIPGTLTVNGTADITEGTLTMVGGTENAKTTVTSTGSLVYNSTNNLSNSNIAAVNGAYYANTDGNNVLTTVSNAIAGALEADTVNVYVIGTVNDTTDVKLGGVSMTVQGTATLGNIDVIDSRLEVTTGGTLTATIVGQYGEDGATGTASIVLNKAKITGVNNTSTVNAQNVNEWTLTYTTITGNATISQGTVVANAITGNQESDKNTDTLTIASGATLLVKGTVEIENYKAFNVEGTLEITNNGDLTLTGIDKMVISGTMTVTGEASVADMIVTGTLDVTDTETAQGTMTVTGSLSVGEAAKNLGATGTVNGPVNLGTNAYVLAYPGTTVALTSFGTEDNVKSTQFYINGALYVTAYTLGDVLAIGTDADENNGFMADVEITGYVTKDVINNPAKWSSDAAMETALVASGVTTFNIGTEEAAYIQLTPDKAEIQYSVGSGISLYVDGIRVESSSTPVTLSVGTHTVTATVNPGYTGDVTITFNGQTVTGGTFEVTPEMAAETAGSFVLSATGNISVDTGSTGSSDDGMGLTEILLIILVILIVVMAIMVALRLMRS